MRIEWHKNVDAVAFEFNLHGNGRRMRELAHPEWQSMGRNHRVETYSLTFEFKSVRLKKDLLVFEKIMDQPGLKTRYCT